MKNSSVNLFLCAAAVLLLGGCMVEEIAIDESPESVARTFKAEFAPQTKTSIEMDGSIGKILWEAGDAISILDGVSNQKVVIAADNIIDGGRKAIFTVDVAPDSTYYAVYPYSTANAVVDGKLVTVKPSATQDGSFGSSHISAAEFTGTSSSLTFHNVVSLLMFSQSSKDIAKITFSANCDDMIFDDVASVEVTTGAAGTYYFSLPAFSLPNGFTITAFDVAGKNVSKAVFNDKFSMAAGEGRNLGCIDDHLVPEVTHDYLFGQSAYGVYYESGETAYIAYDRFLDQIGVGLGTFRIVNPNTSEWLSITGLALDPSVGEKCSIQVDQNYSGRLSASFSGNVTVGKVEDDSMAGTPSARKVWLYGSDGVGYVVRLVQGNDE